MDSYRAPRAARRLCSIGLGLFLSGSLLFGYSFRTRELPDRYDTRAFTAYQEGQARSQRERAAGISGMLGGSALLLAAGRKGEQ